MRVQIVISGLLLDPGCDVGADYLVMKLIPILSRFVDIVSRTNTIMEYIFILLRGAAAVDGEYSVRLVIAALLVICFVQLCTDFMVNEGLTLYNKQARIKSIKLIRLITIKPAS